MNTPGDPILNPKDSVNHYSRNKHMIAEGILINIFHRFPFLYGCPASHTPRNFWKLVHRGLVAHGYISPNGRYLTEKGFLYVQAQGEKFPHD